MSYPRLYAANAAVNKYGFETLGIGTLSDAITCVITEERNGEFELEMEYPIDGIHFNDLDVDKLIMCKASEASKQQIFRIYKVEKTIEGIATVYAEHISYLLSNVSVLPFGETDIVGDPTISTAQKAFDTLKEKLLWKTDHADFPEFPFSFKTTVDKTGSFILETPSTVRSVLGGTDGSILDVFGGEYEFDNFNITLHKQRGTDTDVYLRYGKNITDLTSTNDISSSYTGILPYWKGSLQKEKKDSDGNKTVESYDALIYINNKVLWSDYVGNYAYPLTSVVDFSSEIGSDYKNKTDDDGNVTYYTTESDIREKLQSSAEEYLSSNTGWKPSDNLEISFINLWDTEEYKDFAALQTVSLCDTVHVIYPKLNIEVTMKVITTEYDVLKDRYDSIELGEPKSSFTTSVANSTSSTESKIEELTSDTGSKIKQAQQEAADMINGKLNNLYGVNKGYIQFDTDASGNITQLVCVEEEKQDRSGDIIVLNSAGLGFSQNGLKDVTAAITINGKIIADVIKTGILEDGAGIFYLNMETGELNMKDGTFSGTLEVVKGKIGGFTIVDNAIYMNKTGDGKSKGSGIYIGEKCLSIGQTDAGVPVFSIHYNGDKNFPYTMVTLLSFTHGDSYGSCGSIDSWKGEGWGHSDYGYGLQTTCKFRVGSSADEKGDLYVDGDIKCKGDVEGNASDRRLKQGIVALDNAAVDFILKLNPVRYEYKRKPDRIRHGFIAQDVQEIQYDGWDPAHVGWTEENGDDTLVLDYIELIPDMVKTIQYQNDRINDLESRIKRMEELLNAGSES